MPEVFSIVFAIGGILLVIYRDKIATATIQQVESYWTPKLRFLFKKDNVKIPTWYVRAYSCGLAVLGVLFILGSIIAFYGPIRT